MSTITQPAVDHVADVAGRAKVAARRLVLLTRAVKDAALEAVADALLAAEAEIVAANGRDLERGRAAGMGEGLLDRLLLTPARIGEIAAAVREVAALPDPVGEVVRGSTLPNGLQIRQIRVPMGVVGMIYEARPNVTVDAAALALKSGNAVVLRGGSAAQESNRVLVSVIRRALAGQGLPEDAVGLLDEGGRDAARALMTARGLVDLVIPRGGADLISTVVMESTVPVIETGIGVNHVYVDAAADLDMALTILMNSKTHRPSVCNAAESLLVHAEVAAAFLPKAIAALAGAGVALHVAPEVAGHAEAAGAAYSIASEQDYDTEWHRLEMNVREVADLDAALAHIREHGSMHTEV
ncbi:MAG TPA: glutamate-5-semialdehyde dehydrogenase, partial [Dermatophilaceae bacterium]|nr:glutamate-5-semialdehyde dehydrogenase [Dermatophilaceae bacterium]